MNDTYLQDFGTRRSIHRARPKVDPMAASGRWDDLYLRASKPYLRKKFKRDSMRKETKLYFTKKIRQYTTVDGKKTWSLVVKKSASIPIQPNAEVGQLLGFQCDEVHRKYKLDTPSYPARHRELSLEDRRPQNLVKMVPVGWKPVYASLRQMIHKIRMRDRRLTRLLVDDFRVLWPMRHELKKQIDPRVEKPLGFGESIAPKPEYPTAPAAPKATKPANFKAMAKEYKLNVRKLADLSFNEESASKAQIAERDGLVARQRELFRLVGRWL
jgi:hypothetical protein